MPAEPRPLPADLLRVLVALDSTAGVADLLEDLLSPAELGSVGERWAIVKALAAGEAQRAVRDQVGCSVATVSRGAKQLRYGTGGFERAFAVLRALETEAP